MSTHCAEHGHHTHHKAEQHIYGRVEAGLLLLVAGYISWLVSSDSFWQMLNPRFQWMETAAAAVLFLCGGALMLRPARSSILRLSTFSLLILLLAVTLWGPAGMALPKAELDDSPFAVNEPEPSEPLELGGETYERISTIELLNLLEKRPETALGRSWALRGVVVRTPELDEHGSFGLVRPFIWCCLADAVAVGFVTPYAAHDSLEQGQWVRVAGRLEEIEGLKAEELELSLGPFFVALDQQYALVPDSALGDEAVEIIKEPGVPYVFTLRESAPFSW